MSLSKRLCPALWSLALFMLVGSLAQAEVLIGMTEKDLLAGKGPPVSKAAFKDKSIYTWQDVRVTLESGAVVKVELRDVKKEQASDVRRTQLAIDEKKKLETIRKAREIEGQRHAQEQRRRLAASAKAESEKESDFDRDRRLRMERYSREREIAHREEQMRQLDASAKRSSQAGHTRQAVHTWEHYYKTKSERDQLLRENQRK